MNIVEKKNQIQDLLNDVFNEYNRMNETKIQSKCETDLEMRTMISNIRSLETSNLEKDDRIKNLEKTINDYEKMINDLNDKLEIKEECDKESNRHDMLRIQAKEITEKDREIKRLNGLLDFHKKEKEKAKINKIDTLMNVVANKENTDLKLSEVKEVGTGEENPNFIYNDHRTDKESVVEEEDEGFIIKTPLTKYLLGVPVEQLEAEYPAENFLKEAVRSTQAQPEPEPEPEPASETTESDGDKSRLEQTINNSMLDQETHKKIVEPEPKTIMKVKSKGIFYFVYKDENPQDMFEYNEEKNLDKIVGKRTKIGAKYKIELF
jgi:hypothetical protein